MTLEIANKLTSLRRARGVSQEELAAVIGVSRQAISKWERGEASPEIDNIILLSRFYGVSVSELLCCGEEYESAAEETLPEPEYAGEEPLPVLRAAPVPEDGALYGSVSDIVCAARADLELFGVEGEDITVNLEGSEREKEECSIYTEGSELHIETPKNERRIGFFLRRTTLKIIVGVPDTVRRVSAELWGGDANIENVNVKDAFVKTGGGDIEVMGSRVKGLVLTTGGGDISVTAAGAETAQIRTGGGDIEVNDLTANGALELHTGGGDMKVVCAADSVTAFSGGGDIELQARARVIDARSGGGDLNLKANGAESVSAKTGGGDIELKLSGVSGAAFDLATAGGEAELCAFGERIESGKRVSAAVGDGSAKIELKSAGGDVTVSVE
jgi:transcriptional regulator with XRE-family HTH domain